MTLRTLWVAGLVGVGAAALLGCSSLGSVRPPAAELLQANQAYHQGNYTTAVRDYRALLAREGYSVPVLYNLGNAWLRLNQPGRAILNYERALWLAPANPAVTHNLLLVQRQTGHAVTQVTPLSRALGWFSLDALAWIGTGAAMTLAAAVLTARWRASRPLRLLRSLAAISALVLLLSSALVITRWPELDRGVVLAAATPARIAPAAAANVSFVLQSGDLVQIGRPYHAYVQVHAAGGRSGWVRTQQVAPILGPPDN